MLQRFNKISLKYSTAFIGVALALLAVVITEMLLVHTVKQRMTEFGVTFNVATSAILNADRDLYQAHLATVEYLALDPDSGAAKAQIAAYKENAQQARDRMQKFRGTLAAYPDVLHAVQGFEALYDRWTTQTEQVFSLYGSGRESAAATLLNGKSQAAFADLRAVYNAAEEATDSKIKTLEAATRAQIFRKEVAVGIFSLIVVLVAAGIALAGPLMMSRAIRRITDRIRDISEGDGDLTARIDARRGDEIGDLARRFNAFVERIDVMLQSVRTSSNEVTRASNEIARGSQDLASRTEQSSANLQQTSASLEQITATVSNTSDAAEKGSELAHSSVAVARRGEQAMRNLEQTMEDISQSAAQIGEITSLIDGIAFQTNLLALNASVEAARAGEQGRGFAVVAQEVRTLAGRASDASRSIRELIDTSVTRTRSGAELVRTTGSTMQEIVRGVEQVTEMITEISTGAREQRDGIGQINTAVTELDSAIQHNASMVDETSTAAVHMSEQANQLQALIASFRLSNETNAVGERRGDHPEPESRSRAARADGLFVASTF